VAFLGCRKLKKAVYMNLSPDLVGTIAAIITTSCYIPQVWRCWRLRDVRAISVSMYVLLTAGIMLWLVYGIMIDSWPIIIANIVTICLTGSILAMKLVFAKH